MATWIQVYGTDWCRLTFVVREYLTRSRVELIAPKTTSLETRPIRCRERLGGMLKFYTATPRKPSDEFSHT